jgi:hypothetical protein
MLLEAEQVPDKNNGAMGFFCLCFAREPLPFFHTT